MLHGLWSPGAGLVLWSDDLADLPRVGSPLGEVLAHSKFRHRASVLRAGVTVTVPAIALAPPRAAQVLLGDLSGVSGDLRYLGHVALGIDAWVRAGRVVPELYRADGQWWTRWRLVGGERQRAWQAELIGAMPAALRVAGPATRVFDDLTAELADAIVRTRLGDAAPGVTHPLLASLIAGEPLAAATQAAVAGLDAWRATLTVGEPELVLRLAEPDDDEADTALWRLEVCLRPEGEAPQPVPVRRSDPQRLALAVRKLGEAMARYPRLREVPSDPESLDLLLPLHVVTDLVAHGAAELQAAGVTLLLPRAWHVATPSLRVTIAAPAAVPVDSSVVGMNELVSYNMQLALGDLVVTPAELDRLAQAKSDLVRLRGHWVQADRAALKRAARYVAQHNAHEGASLAELLGALAVAPPVPAEVRATGWVDTLLDGGHDPEPVPVPAALHAQLRHYQQRGLDWLAFMSRLGLGAILADDMGLGKTVQVLALLAHERERGTAAPTLLVCPMSVVGNWQREAQRFVPSLRVLVHHGNSRLRGAQLRAAVADADLVLTTYALLARDLEHLREPLWERIVLDEAQHIKNANTAQARAARSVPARHRLALTGTPIENRLEELRAILDYANPKLLGSAQTFRARFAVPIEREHDAHATARLRMVTGPFVLRRVKTDPSVISDLPEKFEMTVRANLTAEQAALYRAVVAEMLRQIAESEGMSRKGAVLAALTRLKQVCNHPAHLLGDGSPVTRRGRHRSGKLALVEDIVESVLADGEKALLFTQFREFGDLVAPYLAERFDVEVPFLHGGVHKRRRDAMVAGFQDSGAPLLVLSLKAGGTGLNLTAANHVVHLDRWWNPAVENQATDRAFRIGQRRDVQVRKLLCVGTVEERIDEMLSGKQELADLVVGAGEHWVTELSTERLAELFRLGADAVGE